MYSADVFDALCALDTTKASGCDNIPPLILKQCSTSLLELITHTLVTCLQTCSFPSEWKTHKITPVFKKGDQSAVANYRPISLLCILSKVLESIVFSKILPFVYPLISHCQFGFMKGRSCASQLLSFLSGVYQSVDDKKPTDVIYLDFKKAFDMVPHNELLCKLWMLGITGPLWQWFKGYITDRKHYVYIKSASSSYLPVLSGGTPREYSGSTIISYFCQQYLHCFL